jgi:hypothetical protein
VEFEPNVSSSDDEETIAQEEKLDSATVDEGAKAEREKEEIEALKRESEMPLEDLLNDLPPGYFESVGKPEVPLPDQVYPVSVLRLNPRNTVATSSSTIFFTRPIHGFSAPSCAPPALMLF